MEVLKVFISQPMSDKTDEEILVERDTAIATVKAKYPDKEVILIDSFFDDYKFESSENNDLNIPVAYLSKAIAKMAEADVAFFCAGYNGYRGCRCEHFIARSYNIPTIYGGPADKSTGNVG